MMTPEPLCVICGPLDMFNELPAEMREKLERVNGPHIPVECPRCRHMMLLGRDAALRLANGQANSMLCTRCLMALVEKV